MKPNEAFHSILFPVDFSEATHATAAHVRGLAEATGARVKLLHVVPWLSAWYSETELRSNIPGDETFKVLQHDAAVQLEIFRGTYFNGIHSSCEVKEGAVAETITETAAAWGVDLIMMPTRGLGRSRPFLIGSTTAKVLHDATCAVWTSPHLTPSHPFACYKHILCSLDRDDIPRGYLEEAMWLASYFESKLSFVTALPSCISGYGEQHNVASLAQEFPQAQLRMAKAPKDCVVLTETGAVGDVVRRTVEANRVDLVIANRGHIQQPFGKFRTHTFEIVLESPCPVLSLCIYANLSKEQSQETTWHDTSEEAVPHASVS